MARDPNIENFFAVLEDEDFSINKVIDSDKGNENLQEFLWYMNESRVEQICEELKKKEDSRRDLVIKNLSQLYPLSRNLLNQIFSSIRGSDYHFIKGFDIGRQFLDTVKSLLLDIENKTGRTTKLFQDYKKDVEKKEQEAENLRMASEQFKELKEQRDRLELEIQRLQTEVDGGKLKQDIENLKDEELKLRNRLRQNEEDYNKRHATVNELKNELQAMESKLDSNEELELLRELLNKFPPDVEDEK